MPTERGKGKKLQKDVIFARTTSVLCNWKVVYQHPQTVRSQVAHWIHWILMNGSNNRVPNRNVGSYMSSEKNPFVTSEDSTGSEGRSKQLPPTFSPAKHLRDTQTLATDPPYAGWQAYNLLTLTPSALLRGELRWPKSSGESEYVYFWLLILTISVV